MSDLCPKGAGEKLFPVQRSWLFPVEASGPVLPGAFVLAKHFDVSADSKLARNRNHLRCNLRYRWHTELPTYLHINKFRELANATLKFLQNTLQYEFNKLK